ncbi:MAG: sodium:solute symporter [Acidobacteria bacterium RIFCSPLOWO2_02_FULL_65_29]|nr:MAG: sodium:solute symporter [Acidobacteria bacterium RIFCSPLOWO2_02_FULL_65_29]
MHPIDWLIVVVYFVWVVTDGLRRTKNRDRIEGYFLASRSLPWWVAGLSVMATQLSAITLVGTTGQGYATGLRFIQFYFGLPLAMILLSLTLVPFFHRAKVYTAYEYLERRFDARTRSLTSFLFLMSRAFSLGVVIAAPAVVISAMLGWGIPMTVALLSVPMVFYTAFGGVQAVAWTDVKQMVLIVFGVVAAVVVLFVALPEGFGLRQVLALAGSTGRLEALDFRFDVRETYTFWSGMIGGLFLMLSYFGCDQSQVQRYLTAKSVDEARRSLLMSAYVKIPLQLLILGTGVLVFVFYVFVTPPMLFNRVHDRQVAAGPRAAEYAALQREFDDAIGERREAARLGNRNVFLAADSRVRDIRSRATDIVKAATGDDRYTDVNYVFPTFITTQLPVGLVGLMIAAIFAAAMSTAAGELSALSSATVIDFYRRHLVQNATDRHYLSVSKVATAAWGVFACIVALYAADQGSLIEVVNRYGSLFYGSILGVFLLAVLTRRATATGAFWGLISGMAVVVLVAFWTPVAFLWHNLIGAVTVVVIGLSIAAFSKTGGS